jgi:hypothetical protein
MKIKKIKIVKSENGQKLIKEAILKSTIEINGIEIAIAKDSERYYPFQAYHKASGQPIGDPKKQLKDVVPELKEKMNRIFNQPERWENFLILVNQQEIINKQDGIAIHE